MDQRNVHFLQEKLHHPPVGFHIIHQQHFLYLFLSFRLQALLNRLHRLLDPFQQMGIPIGFHHIRQGSKLGNTGENLSYLSFGFHDQIGRAHV